MATPREIHVGCKTLRLQHSVIHVSQWRWSYPTTFTLGQITRFLDVTESCIEDLKRLNGKKLGSSKAVIDCMVTTIFGRITVSELVKLYNWLIDVERLLTLRKERTEKCKEKSK